VKTNLKVAFYLALAVVVSCVTVNIYFPAAEVQKAADEIVGGVRGQPGEEQPAPQKNDGSWLLPTGPAMAYAQVDVNVTTPAIRALKGSLKNRFPALKPYYDRGALGETNQGLVEQRDTEGLNLKEKAELKRLADDENKDRMELYSEIIKANEYGKEVMPQVQKIFANSWRESAGAGWWIEQDDGKWLKK
jgi:uncharacterized protein YdbL (DUF1318 family)